MNDGWGGAHGGQPFSTSCLRLLAGAEQFSCSTDLRGYDFFLRADLEPRNSQPKFMREDYRSRKTTILCDAKRSPISFDVPFRSGPPPELRLCAGHSIGYSQGWRDSVNTVTTPAVCKR